MGFIVVSDADAEEGAQEDIEFFLRYRPELSIGTEVTDDLGRVWQISSTRTLEDRRYLLFEGYRTLTTGG